MARILITLALFLATLLPVDAARGQDADAVTITATPQFTRARAGDRMAIAVRFDLAEHMHIWPNKPIAPPGVPGFSAIPTAITVGGDSLGFAAFIDRIKWPEPVMLKVAGMDAFAHADSFTVFVPVTIAATAKAGEVTIPLHIKSQACNDSTCFMPQEIDAPVTITVVGAAEATKASDPSLFTGFDTSVFNTGAPTPAPGPATPHADIGIGGWTVSGLGLILLMAFIGGIILNCTPCVLPIIPLKIMGLHQQSGSRSRTAWLGLFIFLGVAFFWLLLGALIAFGVLGGISELSSYWWFNLFVAVFMTTMGLGMFDLFTVGLPKWVYNIEVGHDTLQGSFLFGIMTAVLATPCVAPFAGGAAAWALTQPPLTAMLVFFCLGLGMGTPYLILAMFPNLVAWIPRAGPGSELLKQVLGMLMISFGVMFLGWAVLSIVATYPWVAKDLHWWAVTILIGATALWMIWRLWQITRSPVKRMVFTLLALALLVGGYLWAYKQTAQSRTFWVRQQEAIAAEKIAQAHGGPGLASTRLWDDYDAAAIDTDLKAGRVVVLDFTADWCFTCKVLESTVLYTPDIDRALQADGVRSYKVDLTSRQAPGWDRLRALGGVGVPYLVILGPGRPATEPWTRNAYTISEVTRGIEDSKAKSAAVR